MSSQAHDEDYFDPWWREALCAEVGSDLFFVRKGEKSEEAKAVCALCPVRTKCLADALRTDVEYGIFGGFSRIQRVRLRARVNRGEDPMEVAEAAIEREKRKQQWKK